ncbi:uncharacterized protein [Nicotiana tomentosiformis]|uniref:uncharacterized protein n=1 Tax=Nicotiana tomentosiformis TaxID=4098 RepID=UPI00051BCE32|nr:uncharacterized protein LOC104120986 [Nicotiana tomentosiformis]
MADKSSRALVLYGDGLARFLNPTHTHLHSFASRACCGFLSLPHSPPSETEDARIVREFAELVDASEAYLNQNEAEISETQTQEKLVAATISERFMGMKAAVISDDLRLKSFCDKLGFTVLELNEVIGTVIDQVESSVLASKLLELLGFQQGKTLDSSQFDLVILHVGAGQRTNGLKDLDHVNRLVGDLMQMAHPGTEVGSRLHMSVVLSYGVVREDDDSMYSIADARPENNSKLSRIFPRQSYTIKEGKPRPNVRQYCPMLVAQWQNAVTRKDMAEAYLYKDFKEYGANLVIPADRFLHEVAFKMWKAPKYGA